MEQHNEGGLSLYGMIMIIIDSEYEIPGTSLSSFFFNAMYRFPFVYLLTF